MASYGKTINEFIARCDRCRKRRPACATIYRVVYRNLLRSRIEYSDESETMCRECRIAFGGGRNFRLDARHGRREAARLAMQTS